VLFFRLGTVGYEEAYRLQKRLAEARGQDVIGDVVLLLQHRPVITIGRGGGEEDVLASASQLRREGVRLVATDRGGKATYHGPGQLVAYPIMKVERDRLYDFVRRLEETTIQALATYGIAAGRLEEHPGVWVDGDKIAAIGLAVRDGVTRHGLALNVAPRMAHFELLIPCGITDHGVTSMAQELGRAPDLVQVSEHFVDAFAEVFERDVEVRNHLDDVFWR
jgi:lipoyl(octanoyl) transferase